MQQPQPPHPTPLSILLPFGVALCAVVALRISGHPEGITDVFTLLSTLYAVMGWRNIHLPRLRCLAHHHSNSKRRRQSCCHPNDQHPHYSHHKQINEEC